MNKQDKQAKVWFAAEKAAGTLRGAVLSNPTAAVRALGPLEVIRVGCGTDQRRDGVRGTVLYGTGSGE